MKKEKDEIRKEIRREERSGRVLNREAHADVQMAFRGRNVPVGKLQKMEKSVKALTKNWTANVREHIKMQNCLTPQCCAFLDLLDDPFNARWEDAKYPFYPGGQPLKSTVVRAFGVTNFTLSAVSSTGTQIYWCPNPAYSYEDQYNPMPNYISRGATLQKGVIGCPPFSVANASGTGASAGACAGLMQHGVAISNLYTFDPAPVDTDQYIAWDTASSIGEDAPDQPGAFAYRLVAAGLRLICTSEEVGLGGLISSARISESANGGVFGTTIMNSNSSAHYERGGGTMEMKYARSQNDDRWYMPSATQAATPSAALNGCRHFITIIPAKDTVPLEYTLVTVAFYEVKGVAAKTVGTPSFQQPAMAGKVATAMSHVAQEPTGGEKGSSKREFRDAVELVNAKEHPALGKVAQDATDKKGFLEKIEDYAKDIIPVAKTIAEIGMTLI